MAKILAPVLALVSPKVTLWSSLPQCMTGCWGAAQGQADTPAVWPAGLTVQEAPAQPGSRDLEVCSSWSLCTHPAAVAPWQLSQNGQDSEVLGLSLVSPVHLCMRGWGPGAGSDCPGASSQILESELEYPVLSCITAK